MKINFIALLTDFGLKDGFAGVMKGVIYSINPEAKIIDLSHGVTSGDIEEAAWTLFTSYSYFPQGTLFVCITDPGVGSARKVVYAQTDKYAFLAPDNGLLTYIKNKEGFNKIISVENKSLFLEELSGTFHGRDIFAPVAGHLSNGLDAVTHLGKQVEEISEFDIPQIKESNSFYEGNIVHIDKFGNCITNIQNEFANNRVVEFRGRDLGTVLCCYSQVPRGEPIALMGSCGFMELGLNGGSFTEKFYARRGDTVSVRK